MERYYLYNGEIELCFDPKKHVYSVDGEKVTSVTGITGIIDKSGPLMWWAVGQAVDYMEERINLDGDELELAEMFHDARRAHVSSTRRAATIGSEVHRWIERWLRDESPTMPRNKEMGQSIESFLEWAEEVKLQPVEVEFKAYSKKHNYAGTCDLDGIISGERCIADWKTGKAVYPEHMIQVSGYEIAREEELGVDYDARWVIVLPKDGGEIITQRFGRDTREEHQAGFLGALATQRFVEAQKPRRRKK